MIKVAVIGQGYVGLPIAVHAAKNGYRVIGFDANLNLVSNLNTGKSHIEDISNEELEELISLGTYRASSNSKDLIDVEIAIIAVPTPLDSDRNPDLSFVESASKTLANSLKTKALIINESTSYPGTLRKLISPLFGKLSKIEHLFAISPERVDPGNNKWGISNTPRLFAGLTPEASAKTREFYSKFCDNLIEVSSPEVAEAAKLFENSFRQVNIALVNELAIISRSLGISVREVLDAADSKPYGFMKFNPGLGVGGHCIPVDPSYLAFAAKQAGAKADFIQLANKVNLHMPARIVERIKNENRGTLINKKILVCGLSYKPNVADVRESPSLQLIDLLQAEGAEIKWHDPIVSELNNEKSTELLENSFDICILAMFHSVMDLNKIFKAAPYVFDCIGLIPEAQQI
jgi:UDP-N-acetyl-D-glucosamine dehydrogenase